MRALRVLRDSGDSIAENRLHPALYRQVDRMGQIAPVDAEEAVAERPLESVAPHRAPRRSVFGYELNAVETILRRHNGMLKKNEFSRQPGK
jgi:hypothetical protein